MTSSSSRAASPFAPATATPRELAAELLRALEQRDAVSPRERAALVEAMAEVRVHPAGDTLVRAHVPVEASTLLLQGMLARVKHQVDGRRQIVALHVAGDFVDLHGFVLKRLDHDVAALTDVKIALFPHDALRRITEEQPHLTRLLWLLTMIDAATHREWIGRPGHSAAVRVAALLCEIETRLRLVGIGSGDGFPLELTQADIGDMTQLTPVHVNRTLRKLREAGLAVMRAGYVSVPDLARLRDFAQFDPDYLYLEPTPR